MALPSVCGTWSRGKARHRLMLCAGRRHHHHSSINSSQAMGRGPSAGPPAGPATQVTSVTLGSWRQCGKEAGVGLCQGSSLEQAGESGPLSPGRGPGEVRGQALWRRHRAQAGWRLRKRPGVSSQLWCILTVGTPSVAPGVGPVGISLGLQGKVGRVFAEDGSRR